MRAVYFFNRLVAITALVAVCVLAQFASAAYFPWHLQDATFNESRVVNSSGTLVERYEYAAYGQRQVFTSAGSNDPGCYAPVFASRKVVIGSVSQPWGLNEIGHQGLLHDEQTGLVYNRARMLQPTLGRFMQNDPLGYVDGLNTYEYCGSNSVRYLDSLGFQATTQPNDLARARGMRSCEESRAALLREMKDPNGRGVLSSLYACARKNDCLNEEGVECVWEPEKPWYGLYEPARKTFFLNAAKNDPSRWRTTLHELVHAADCKKTFDANNRCLDRMIVEARAYWRAECDTCEQACERAWDSAKSACYVAATQELFDRWLKDAEEWRKNPRGDPPRNPLPNMMEWMRQNRNQYIAACKEVCGKGPLANKNQPDRDCAAQR
jgi:RHS repeat-associated protein